MKKELVIIFLCACMHHSLSFMTMIDFSNSILKRCYAVQSTVVSSEIVNGQQQPLPSSLETFLTLVERIESKYPSMQTTEVVRNLLMSFRVDDLPPDFRKWPSAAKYSNNFERVFFSLPETITYVWKEEDFSDDEKCALHFMLSHTINTTAQGKPNEELLEDGSLKHPREYGVVSLYGKWKHAFALNKVLLGILSGLSGNNQMDAATIYRNLGNGKAEEKLNNVKVNRLYATTIGDLVSAYVNNNYKRGDVNFIPNGIWNDAACTTQYGLSEYNNKYISNSLLRGAIDGLIIGLKLEEKAEIYKKLRLSQIIRMYYGPSGLVNDLDATSRSETQWCSRSTLFTNTRERNEEVVNFYKLYSYHAGSPPLEEAPNDVEDVLNTIQSSRTIFADVSDEASKECGSSDATLDKRCTTPFDVFAVFDWGTSDVQKNFQIEVIGNLSLNFDVRPNGNSIGVYLNYRGSQNRGLLTIAENTGISGCQSCFTRYYARQGGSKLNEIELFQNLNVTLTDFEAVDLDNQIDLSEAKNGAPAKIILLFWYGSVPNNDHRLRDAIWEIEKNFREVTVLAIGTGKDNLSPLTLNDDTDIFVVPSNAANAEDFSAKLKGRICKAPAEFQFKECHRSSRGTEVENRQEGFIGVNKKQYWAMYPKYFLKSFSITLKFKPLDGGQIKVCFSRSYFRIMEDNAPNTDCVESSGDEIKFYTKNPCHKRNEHNCDPFYFSVEGKKPSNSLCESLKCSTPKDIQFEFQHEGISCNAASFLSVSMTALLLAGVFFILQKY